VAATNHRRIVFPSQLNLVAFLAQGTVPLVPWEVDQHPGSTSSGYFFAMPMAADFSRSILIKIFMRGIVKQVIFINA
jgi:hypothetical protein